MRDCNSVLKSMRICLAVDRDSNCLSECFGCDYISHDNHVMDMVRDAADAIEKLLDENKAIKQSNKDAAMRNKLLCDEISRIKEKVPQWVSVEERLPERTNPLHARDTYLVRLESGCIKTLSYEYDNSDRCRSGMSPLFNEGWEKTAVPVTHWMPLPAPPKEETNE